VPSPSLYGMNNNRNKYSMKPNAIAGLIMIIRKSFEPDDRHISLELVIQVKN